MKKSILFHMLAASILFASTVNAAEDRPSASVTEIKISIASPPPMLGIHQNPYLLGFVETSPEVFFSFPLAFMTEGMNVLMKVASGQQQNGRSVTATIACEANSILANLPKGARHEVDQLFKERIGVDTSGYELILACK